MDRETKKIEVRGGILQGGHTFQVKTYATAREANTIRQAYFTGTKIEVVGEQPKISEFNPGIQFEVQKEMIGQLVVSMDGKTEGIIDRCLELPTEEFDELASQLDELVSKKKS